MTNLENQLQCATEFVSKALKDLFFVLISENMCLVFILSSKCYMWMRIGMYFLYRME